MEGGRRIDIQVLRGIAVLLVIVYHAFPSLAPHGYLGVDIFFVISGYLVGGIILRDLAERRFSFVAFYTRRFWRLGPACLVTLAVTTVLAWWLLLPEDRPAYAEQLLGAVTFTANIVLPGQLNYFSPEAVTKPLLHIWSLSLEEQFYLAAPVLLWLARPKSIPTLLICLTLISVGLCLFLSSLGGDSAKFAFFSLATRAWQLLVGTAIAWRVQQGWNAPPLAPPLGLAVLLLVPVIGLDPVHPRLDALIVVIATGAVLAGKGDWLKDRRMLRPLVKVGDWSYSLYLIHWPLLSFLAIVTLEQTPRWMRLVAVALTFILAAAQYRFVEQRFRNLGRRAGSWRQAILVGGVPILAAASLLPSGAQAAPQPEPAPGIRPECAQPTGSLVALASCATGPAPSVAVWGDSHAIHLLPGLMSQPGLASRLMQITKYVCPPILGVAPKTKDPRSSQDCMSYNAAAYRRIGSSPSLRVVVMGASWVAVLGDAEISFGDDASPNGGRGLQALRQTIASLQSRGKRVVLVGPVPEALFHIGQCVARREQGYLMLARPTCDVSAADPVRVRVERQLRSAGADTLVLPSESMCRGPMCRTSDGSASLYRDFGHLSFRGSRRLAELQLAAAVRRQLGYPARQ